MRWMMKVSGKPVPLAEYPVRATRQGVMVEVNKGKRKLVRGAFIRTMKSGHKGVFRRKGARRLPLRELFTTRVSDVFNDAGFVPAVHTIAQNKFQTTFARLFAMNLQKIKQ
jgi:hypothetical protein